MWILIGVIAAIAVSVGISTAIAIKIVDQVYEYVDDRLNMIKEVLKTIINQGKP